VIPRNPNPNKKERKKIQTKHKIEDAYKEKEQNQDMIRTKELDRKERIS